MNYLNKQLRFFYLVLLGSVLVLPLLACSGARKFQIEKAREQAIKQPATFDQIFNHARKQFDEFSKNNTSKVDLARAATFFVQQISIPASDESQAVKEERQFVFNQVMFQLYALIEDYAVWQREFLNVCPEPLVQKAMATMEDTMRAALLREKMLVDKGSTGFCQPYSYDDSADSCYIKKVMPHYDFQIRFAIVSRAENNQLIEKFRGLEKKIFASNPGKMDLSTGGVTQIRYYDAGNEDYRQIIAAQPFDWGLYTKVGWIWYESGMRAKGEKRIDALHVALDYSKRGLDYTISGTEGRSQIALLKATTEYLLGNAYLADMTLNDLRENHLSSGDLAFLKQLRPEIAVAKARIKAENEAAHARFVEAAANWKGPTWTYTSNPTAGSGPGNSVISPSGMESYTDSHGNKVRK